PGRDHRPHRVDDPGRGRCRTIDGLCRRGHVPAGGRTARGPAAWRSVVADDLDVRGAWREVVTLAEIQRGGVRRLLEADEATRDRIARILGLDALLSLTAQMRATPWLDGAQIEGLWRARVRQTCGVTLE